jgi:uncharacterized OB-fold protein
MGRKGKNRILVGEGLFTVPKSPSEESHLIGSKCKECGEIAFPKQSTCLNCQSESVEEILLGPGAKLYSFTNVNNPVPEGYKGPLPYGVGLLEFPEGIRVEALLTESDPERIKIGMEMVLVVEKLFEDDDGNEVIGFRFRPK